MKNLQVAILGLIAFSAAMAQNQKGAPAVYTTNAGNVGPSTVWIDASQFNASDVCLGIQSAIASLPSSDLAAGVVIDARNYPVAASTTSLTCTVNPFTISPNPLQLAFGGISGTTPSPGSGGGAVLLPGAPIGVQVPWIVPGNWSIFGEGAGVTVLKANFTVPSNPPSSSVSTTASSVG